MLARVAGAELRMSSKDTKTNMRELFRELSGFDAHNFQIEVARRLIDGENLVLVSPTGSGKSWAALLAFIYAKRHGIPFADRLIYAFPLRTLTTALYHQYTPYLDKVGLRPTLQMGGMERGEGDAFFEGDVVFTTIDQLLSSYIGVPVSLPNKLANMPAGALIGGCVVFDEFHLLEPGKSLATTLDLADRLIPYAQVLLMSATFSEKGVGKIKSRIRAGKREVSPEEVRVPGRSETQRRFVWPGRELTAEAVLDAHKEKSIAVCNTVSRATDLYRDLVALARERGIEDRILLLHSRFLPGDRKSKEEELLQLFGEESSERAILVSTQVIEVGLDISAESFHTEVAPASAVFQRAGRCARFGGKGTVYVYDLPVKEDGEPDHAPYLKSQASLVEFTAHEIEARSGEILDFDKERDIIETVHADADLKSLRNISRVDRRQKVAESIRKGGGDYVRQLVREVDSVNLVVQSEPDSLRLEFPLPSVSVSRSVVRRFLSELQKSGRLDQVKMLSSAAEDQRESENYAPSLTWKRIESPKDANGTFYLCFPPALASYDKDNGLILGEVGVESFEQTMQVTPFEPYSYRKETWREHIDRVIEQYRKQEDKHHIGTKRLAEEIGVTRETVEHMGRIVAALHDLAKLAERWQERIWRWQTTVKPNEERDGFLGHSDFDGSDREQREQYKDAKYMKPPHAVESYYAGHRVLAQAIKGIDVRADLRKPIHIALGSAIARHHSAFAENLGEFRLADGYEAEVQKVLAPLGLEVDLRDNPPTKHRASFSDWIINPEDENAMLPLYWYMVRRLRLADQRSQDW
jgi:CRISPR-associated endonuclease/helicase Cas3